MKSIEKKETLLVIFIFLSVFIFFAVRTINIPKVVTEYPQEPAVLEAADMVVSTPEADIVVGKTTRDQVINSFPNGNALGRSTAYRPHSDQDFLLTMSREEEVLIRADIGACDLSTSRGVKVNDSFDHVLEKYGPNYTKSYYQKDPQTFDAFYGSEQYVMFKIEQDIVKKIHIGGPVL